MPMQIKFLLCTLLFTACAAPKPGDEEYTASPKYEENLISEIEIATSDATNAYDLIRKLRPHWLRSRGRRSIKYPQASYPVVYVNQNRYGDINSLSALGKQNITEIRYLDAGDATTFLGTNHAGGAIMVTIFY